MNMQELESIVKGIAPVIHDRINKRIRASADPITAQLTALEIRIAALENRKGVSVSYEGVHDAERSYVVGSLVTKRGGLWLAKRDTATTPGNGDHWKLIVKSGWAE
jgi:hypothetical protein